DAVSCKETDLILCKHASSGGSVQASDDLQQSALTGPIVSNDADSILFEHGQIDIAQGIKGLFFPRTQRQPLTDVTKNRRAVAFDRKGFRDAFKTDDAICFIHIPRISTHIS